MATIRAYRAQIGDRLLFFTGPEGINPEEVLDILLNPPHMRWISQDEFERLGTDSTMARIVLDGLVALHPGVTIENMMQHPVNYRPPKD